MHELGGSQLKEPNPAVAIYRPRHPEKTDLYKVVLENLDLFYVTYDQSFLQQHGPLTAAARKAFEGYIRCGRPQFGFARVFCEACSHEFLVAFSCQQRGGICSSCQQKRAEILCRFVEEEVIAPVGHRQLVFVLPKMLRPAFWNDREMLTALCRSAVDATQTFYRAGLGREDVNVGMVVVPQLFGDKLNAHVHLHALASDGAFDPEGNFHPMPFDTQRDIETLNKLFARNILDLLVRKKRLSERLRNDILSWEHSGFSVDGSVRVLTGDYARLRRLVRYIARPAVSAERVSYDASTGKVTVRSAKKLEGVRPVVAHYDALTFLALLALQVPLPGVHLVRYFGHYSVRQRARRRQELDKAEPANMPAQIDPPKAEERRRKWSLLLRQVFEIEMVCPKCGGELRIISFITTAQQDVIEKILEHLGEPTDLPRSTGPPKWLQIKEAAAHLASNQDWYPEDCHT